MSATPKNMDRWLGDGGMALLGEVGASFERYGVDGEDLGWVEGSFSPRELAGNPHYPLHSFGVVFEATSATVVKVIFEADTGMAAHQQGHRGQRQLEWPDP